MIPHWLLPIIGFLAGSIPFGWIIARVKNIDIRAHGSGNIGATNVGRVLGRPYFFLCFTLDLLKGLIPTLFAGYTMGALGGFEPSLHTSLLWLGTMIAAILGHIFTPWLGFKGGKGVATALGALAGVFPMLTLPAAGALMVWLACIGLWRIVSLASMLAGMSLPIWVGVLWWKLSERPSGATMPNLVPYFVITLALAGLVLWTHRANIRRLRLGTEPKIGQRIHVSPPPPPAPSA